MKVITVVQIKEPIINSQSIHYTIHKEKNKDAKSQA